MTFTLRGNAGMAAKAEKEVGPFRFVIMWGCPLAARPAPLAARRSVGRVRVFSRVCCSQPPHQYPESCNELPTCSFQRALSRQHIESGSCERERERETVD